MFYVFVGAKLIGNLEKFEVFGVVQCVSERLWVKFSGYLIPLDGFEILVHATDL
jgi:hypothetical protein